MTLFTRYVLREILQVFLVTLTALTIFLVLILTVKEAHAQGLGLLQIAQLVPYVLPQALMFAVPGTILFAMASVYGRMSAANEIIALKSLGLSPLLVIWPALLLSVLLSLVTVWLNDLSMSWGYHGMRRVVVDALEDIAYGMLRTHKTFGTSAFSVTVKRVEGHTLIGPNFDLQENGNKVTVSADSAELKSNPGSGVLTIVLNNAIVDASGQYGEFPGYYERNITIDPQFGNPDSAPAHLALRQIPEALSKQHVHIQDIEERMAAQAGAWLMTGNFPGLVGKSWAEDANNLQHQNYRLYRMRTELPRRWASGFSCLCFALVGTAMAIRMKNSDALTSFFLCFLPILLVYYPLLIFGVDRAKAGAITPYAVWLANAIVALWGLWLIKRVIRY